MCHMYQIGVWRLNTKKCHACQGNEYQEELQVSGGGVTSVTRYILGWMDHGVLVLVREGQQRGEADV